MIEHDPLTQRYINDTLSKAGYHVTVAADIHQVLALPAADTPDLVLASLAAPGADGVELMSVLRARARRTRRPRRGIRPRRSHPGALEAGAADYIVKPLLAHRTRRENQGSPAPAHRPRIGRHPRAVQRRRAHHRLRRPHRHRGRPAGAALTHRTPTAVRAVAQRRPSPQPRPTDAPSVAVQLARGPRNRPQRHQETPPQTRGQRHRRFIHHHRAPHGLPNRNPNHHDRTAPEHAALGDATPTRACSGRLQRCRAGGDESVGGPVAAMPAPRRRECGAGRLQPGSPAERPCR